MNTYSQTDIKIQIKAAKAATNGIGEFGIECKQYNTIVKSILGIINTNKDVKNDAYPFIKVKYQNEHSFNTIFYSFDEIKQLVSDLNNFQLSGNLPINN